MHGDSEYNIMFGPDICGPGTKKVHVIFNYKGKNLLVKKDIRCKDDEFTHLYTLIVRPDNTYEVKIDNKHAEGGILEEDWDFLPPKTIPDPEARKPEDWDDTPKIDDPEDTKPEVWDFTLLSSPVNHMMDGWFSFHSRIGTNLSTFQTRMLRNQRIGTTTLMASGNHP